MSSSTAVRRPDGVLGGNGGIPLEERKVLRTHRTNTSHTLCVPLTRAGQPAPTTSQPDLDEYSEEENERIIRPSKVKGWRSEYTPLNDVPPAAKIQTQQRQHWFWRTAIRVVVIIAGVFLILFLIVALGRTAYYRIAYGPSPVTENHIVTGYHDSVQQPSDVVAYTANGQVIVTIAPGGNLQQSVMVEGPHVSGSPAIFLAQGSNQTITVQIVQASSLFNWAPAPYTFTIAWVTNSFQVIQPNQ